MLLILLQFIALVIGVATLRKGRFVLGRTWVHEPGPAYAIGILLTLILPFSVLGGVLVWALTTRPLSGPAQEYIRELIRLGLTAALGIPAMLIVTSNTSNTSKG